MRAGREHMGAEQFNRSHGLYSDKRPNQTHLQFDEVELCGAGVHQRVKVLVVGELGLDESTDVGLRHMTPLKTESQNGVMLISTTRGSI